MSMAQIRYTGRKRVVQYPILEESIHSPDRHEMERDSPEGSSWRRRVKSGQAGKVPRGSKSLSLKEC